MYYIYIYLVNRHDIKQQKKLQTGHRGQSRGYPPIIVQTITIKYK